MAGTATQERPIHLDTVDLKGKVAIITGGTTGIGRTTAILLAEKGVKIVTYGRQEQELRDAENDLKQVGADYLALTADNAYEDQIRMVFQKTREKFGDIDILINNAALPAKSILEMSYDDALYTLRVNVLGYLYCMREAVEMMQRKGGGQIVNIGSLSAKVREIGSDVYVATKGAIEAMSESLRKRLEQENTNIRISLIEPGSVGTNLHGEPPDVEKQRQNIEQEKMLKAEDIAAAIYYILTQPSRVDVTMLQIAPFAQGL